MSYTFEEQRIDYGWIKQMAKQQGVSVNDLIVLAPQNDPFYTGTPTDVASGQWFAELWHHIGDERMHIRRVHYWLVSQGTAKLSNGKPYENTVECWDALNAASKAARYLELVDPGAFNDRRTPETMIYATDRKAEPYVAVNGYLSRAGITLPPFPELPDYSVYGYYPEQAYHLEVWCEKSTMNDVLGPLCERYNANLQTGMGEMSITATLALVHRLQQANKPARILYVSDFDPAGQSMPVAMSRKIEYFVRRFGLALDIRVFPVVLTLEQVQHYGLPRTPIKETERRRGGFEARHGEGAVELDALEALYPGALTAILSEHIEQYYDVSLAERVKQQQRALEQQLSTQWEWVIRGYEDLIQAFRDEYESIQVDVEQRLGDFSGRLRGVWHDIRLELERDRDLVDQYPAPGPEEAVELGDGLYNSERMYVEQIEAYKQFQGRS
ncbi:hypothetical protein KDA_25470 [Dictyobacter alpinus]|uniref:DUF2399 domain-containing protein n=1 Tax=Dictyobacter alpinus TaxID=2014873 RepID=A0A402B6Q8_9CHLR|nr:hypothetical protein [Dictyobacter alpinus]GCE27063.1 hypothetical protein KDA_25470 [Dictyobacter alpinus]